MFPSVLPDAVEYLRGHRCQRYALSPSPPCINRWHLPVRAAYLFGQDLEYPGFEVEDQVWNRLLELRGSKIHKEMELKKQQRLFAVMKRKLESLQADCESVDAQVCKDTQWYTLGCSGIEYRASRT